MFSTFDGCLLAIIRGLTAYMLDFTTVFVFSTAISVLVCIACGLAWFNDAAGLETRHWFIASLLQLTSGLLIILNDVIPLDIGGYIGAVISNAASGYLALGYRQLYGQDARARGILFVSFWTGTAVYLTKFLSGGHQDGIWLLYLGGSVNLIVAAQAVCRGLRAEKLRGENFRYRYGRFAAYILIGYAAAYIVISPLAFFDPIQFVDGKPVSLWLQVTTIPLVLLNMAAYLVTLVVKLERATERQRHLANHDALTGTLNRKAFYSAWSRRTGQKGVLVVIDIDHFKYVNDNYGHLAGDDTLKAFSVAVKQALPHGAVFGRLGGEEFGLLLTNFDAVNTEHLLRDLRTVVSGMCVEARDGRVFTVTFSAGYVGFDASEDDMDHIFAAADRALYAAKRGGRDRIVGFEPGLLPQHDVEHLRPVGVTTANPTQVRA